MAAEKSGKIDDKNFGNMIKEKIDRINAEEKAGNVAEWCIGKTRQLSLRFSYISLSYNIQPQQQAGPLEAGIPPAVLME